MIDVKCACGIEGFVPSAEQAKDWKCSYCLAAAFGYTLKWSPSAKQYSVGIDPAFVAEEPTQPHIVLCDCGAQKAKTTHADWCSTISTAASASSR
jgi:hypothetical protein